MSNTTMTYLDPIPYDPSLLGPVSISCAASFITRDPGWPRNAKRLAQMAERKRQGRQPATRKEAN